MEIKFRQFIVGRFHYWGFIKGKSFVGPVHDSGLGALPWAESQQFTGLLDKNGKEIYEGDILEYFKKYFPVVFKDTWISPFKAGDNCGCCESGSISNQYEVVGNIYENPDLLK